MEKEKKKDHCIPSTDESKRREDMRKRASKYFFHFPTWSLHLEREEVREAYQREEEKDVCLGPQEEVGLLPAQCIFGLLPP